MKKIAAILLCAVAILSDLNAQPLNGSGTFASPYNGIFESDLQWNFTNFPGGKVYINGDVTIDNELLTIEAGISVIFVAEGADLIINGTGRINASGTEGNLITFTADDDNDGSYGETNERWGHIVFDNPSSTNQSIFEYSIIEYGDVRSGSNTTSYGGGIYIRTYSNLVLNYCIIRNNRATHGGAIMLLTGASPLFSGCTITNNTANSSGGGIYSQARNGLSLTNCLITFNTATSGNGGGIFFDGSDNTKIVNCNFLKNSSSVGGKNIHLYNVSSITSRPRFVNSIVWDADNSIEYSGTSVTRVTDFINSAIRDITTPASSFTNCIDLNATNSDPAGPNFNATDGSDWSIKFISPCRDIGTNSYTGVTIPSSDYDGNPRIGTKDIGTYEVQYSRWTGATSTTWATATNWEQSIDPSSGTGDVVIPTGLSNYPTGSTTQDFTIGSEKQMIIEQGASVTLDDLTNNGTIKLNATSAGLASLIINSYSRGGGGSEEIQMFLTGGGTKTPLTYKWHYITPPVTSLAVSTFAPTYTLNIWGWFEDRPVSTLSQGWVAYDGYVSSVEWDYPRAFTTLYAGKGYNYFKSTDYTYTFGGLFNTGDVNASLNYTSGDDQLYGYNLLGNPFSSGLDWDYIITTSFPSNTSKGLYFTRNSVSCTYINGVGVPGDVTGIIPPMQGFFSKTYSSGNTIVLAAAARTHDNIHATYKGSKALIPLVRLELTDDTLSDETVVRFDEEAKSYLDNDFDAVKMFLDPDLSSIYSTLSEIDYCINGLPFPETFVEIPVSVNIVTDATTKTISATQLQGLDDYNVFLIDNATGFSADLKTIPEYTFSAAKGTVTDRFILKISNVATSIETPAQTEQSFNVYHGLGSVNIQTVSDIWDGKSGSVRLLDMTGKSVNDIRNAVFSRNSLLSIPAPSAKGLYIVEIQAGLMRYVGKVIVK